MGTRPLLIGCAVLLAAVPAVASMAQSGCSELDLVRGASRPEVRGVVERSPVASNPLPWGTSISAVTRVWGGVVVERWGTASELSDCIQPGLIPTYEAVGLEETLVPAAGEISGLELAALRSQFGPPVEYSPSGFDRLMAWLRVFPSVPVVVVLVSWSAVTLRRRRHRHDGYLF